MNIILTRDNIHQLATDGAGGFTRAQIEALGFVWPAKKGWINSLIGKTMTMDFYNRVAELSKMYSKQLKKLKKQQAQQDSFEEFACY
jgi:hypothetical protein